MAALPRWAGPAGREGGAEHASAQNAVKFLRGDAVAGEAKRGDPIRICDGSGVGSLERGRERVRGRVRVAAEVVAPVQRDAVVLDVLDPN